MLRGAHAQEVEGQIEKIKAEVEASDGRLQGIITQRTERESALTRLQKEMSKIRAEQAALNRRLEEGRVKKGEVDRELDRLSREMNRLRTIAASRVRALYMYRSRALADHVIGASSSGELLKNVYLLGKVSAHDRAVLEEIRVVVAENETALKKLAAINAEQLKVKGELAKKGAALRAKVEEQQRLIAEIEAEQVKAEEELAGLRAQALRLETVLISLIDGDEEDARGSKQAASPATSGAALAPFSGPGLDPPRGRLRPPVKGALLVSFGRTKMARFEDYVMSKGQEYRAAPGTAVKAVGDGRVLHVGPMPGYGTIVIIDHGSRSYSLYGKMTEIRVQKGAELDGGDEIGVVGPAEGEGGNLYFEIRKNGTPVDPKPYLR